jgi:hypothetical protein
MGAGKEQTLQIILPRGGKLAQPDGQAATRAEYIAAGCIIGALAQALGLGKPLASV